MILKKTTKLISIQNDGILERPILGPLELLAVKNYKGKMEIIRVSVKIIPVELISVP